MAKLEAMLEQRGIATPREMSEAIARCQLHGGDLTTSLLQFMSADESQLCAALSECYGLPAAAVGALPAPDDAALRSLPRDIAENYCCFPLEASPGRLVLAVARPLEPALREELGFTLGVSIEERVALEVRIRQALSRFYGLPLSARNQRGIARLEGDMEGTGHETPLGIWSDAQLAALPRPPSDLSAARESQRPPSVRPRSRSDGPRSDAPRAGGGASSPPGGPRSSRRRGPLSLARAREELTRAPTRNDVLDIFFGFASQFFEYSALFAVHNSLAEGLDAWGKGADRDTVLGIGVPLDLPSSLSEVAESCKVRLTRLGKEGIDRTLAADLQRQFNAKALVLPVSLRGRCAVLLYADNGEADVVEREVADVIAIAPDVANALARIILQRKKEARQRAPENADLSSLARRSRPPQADSGPSVASLLEVLEPIVNENRERSRNNARRSSRPDASPAPLRAEGDGAVVAGQRVVSIGPDSDGASPSPPPGEVGASGDAGHGEDPVFLLARPQGKRRLTPMPRPLTTVEKPQVSITHPAPIIATRPRLPSVIVDPESADPEASERLTRAAAITRAPTQARNGSARRPLVPELADAPRTLGPPSYQRTARPGRGRDAAARRHEVQHRQSDALAREAAPAEAPLREQPAPEPVEFAPKPEPRAALHPTSIELAEAGIELAEAGIELAEAGIELAEAGPPSDPPDDADDAGEAARTDEDILGPTSNAWPPPIMDNSPPPRQPPLTALVPIIIADAPKGRRGYTSRTATTARPGGRPASGKGPSPRATSSSAPPAHGPASPTVPSPARTRQLEAAAARTVASREPDASAPAPVALVGAAAPLASASPAATSAPAVAGDDAATAAGDAASSGARAAGAGANPGSGPRLTNALARAAARAAHAAAPRSSETGERAMSADLSDAVTEPPPAPHPIGAASAADAGARPGSRPPPAPSARAAAASLAAASSSPRRVPPAASGERGSRPPPARELDEALSAHPAGAAQDPAAPGSNPAASNPAASNPAASDPVTSDPAEEAPHSTVLGLGTTAARRGATGAAPVSSVAASPSPLRAASGTPLRSAPGTPRALAAGATTQPMGTPVGTLIGVSALPEREAAAAPEAPAGEAPAGEAPAAPVTATGATSSGTASSGTASSGTASSGTPSSGTASSAVTAPAAPSPSLAASAFTLGDDTPPDSVELAWDALISASSPPAAPAPSPGSPAVPERPASNAPAASAPPSSAAPSRPIHPIPSRSIDSDSSAPRSSPAAPPSARGSGTPAPGAAPPEARAAIFPPPAPVDAEIEELVEQVCQGNLRAVQDLARLGAASVPQVMARFPGPVISERAGPSSRASECGPLLQALASIGSPALPSVTLSSEHEDARVRRWATLLLGEMPCPEACRAVVQRLADDVPRVHQAALDAARLLLASSAADLFRKTLFEVAEAEDAPLTLRLRTLEHVAKLKDSASVPGLISFLGADLEPIVHKALWALTVVTRHDFGRDVRAWTDFWDANQSRHRIEWLIDALDGRDPRLRRAAADELREEAGTLFGYAEDLPRPERLVAQRELRSWWEATGAPRHARERR